MYMQLCVRNMYLYFHLSYIANNYTTDYRTTCFDNYGDECMVCVAILIFLCTFTFRNCVRIASKTAIALLSANIELNKLRDTRVLVY